MARLLAWWLMFFPLSAPSAELPHYYQLTSRPCPPNCITPFSPHPDVRTNGEKELQALLDHRENSLIIDVRRPEIVRSTGAIAGVEHIPFFELGLRYGADAERHEAHLKHFGVRRVDGRHFDFDKARPLVFLDDGIWDGAALRNIRTLLGLGYPPDRLYWYRGGMNDWLGLGLPVTKEP